MSKKIKSYNEAEIIRMFSLKRLAGNDATPLMSEWANVTITLNIGEQYLFDIITEKLLNRIVGWNEEMLKMNFISPVLILGQMTETDRYKTYYESPLEATIEGQFLKVKADMMIASGIMEYPETPYFYFQEYKKVKDPRGDVTAQLLEAFLIAQEKNQNDNRDADQPIYGCTVSGKQWEFVIMEGKSYCISQSYDCTNKDNLMQIIAMLRKFKEILETRMLD